MPNLIIKILSYHKCTCVCNVLIWGYFYVCCSGLFIPDTLISMFVNGCKSIFLNGMNFSIQYEWVFMSGFSLNILIGIE